MLKMIIKKMSGKDFRFLFFEENTDGKMTKDFSFDAKTKGEKNYNFNISNYLNNKELIVLEEKTDMSGADIFQYISEYLFFSIDYAKEIKEVFENEDTYLESIKKMLDAVSDDKI
jgi:hypothetical protein